MKQVLAIWVLLALSSVGSSLAASQRNFPFTAEEDSDGARYVWFKYQQAGFPYEYLPAKDMLTSRHLKPAPKNKRQTGDVAWWKQFVAIYDPDAWQTFHVPKGRNLLTAPGVLSLRDLEKRYGPVKWLRYWKPDK